MFAKKVTCYNIHIEGIGGCIMIDKLMKYLKVVCIIVFIFALVVLLYCFYVGYYAGTKKLILVIINLIVVSLLCLIHLLVIRQEIVILEVNSLMFKLNPYRYRNGDFYKLI